MKNTPAQLKSVLSLLALSIALAACSSGPDAQSPAEAEDFPVPTPDLVGDPGPVVGISPSSGGSAPINSQVFTGLASDGGLDLLAYDQSSPLDSSSALADQNPRQVFKSDAGIIHQLNTVWEANPVAEKSVYVSGDTIGVYDHVTGVQRNLLTLPIDICTIFLSETLEQVESSGELELRKLHRNEVYIEAAQFGCSGSIAERVITEHRYFRLPLNYKREAAREEICVSAGGANPDPDTCFVTEYDIVTEPEARAQLVYAWVPEDATDPNTDYVVDFGYLGHGFDSGVESNSPTGRLNFYDNTRELKWSTQRNVEINLGTAGPNELGVASVFNVARLGPEEGESFSYLAQLGRDVFAFDASTELFPLVQSNAAEFLSDRVYRMDEVPEIVGVSSRIEELEFVSTDSTLLFIDNNRFYSFDYSGLGFTPTNRPSLTWRNDLAFFANAPYESVATFSQFDNRDCQELVRLNGTLEEGDPDRETDQQLEDRKRQCSIAHDVSNLLGREPEDVGSNVWQLFYECDSALGCSIPVDETDYCVTESELLADPSLADGRACSTRFYTDLNELDTDSNAPSFLGFLQYNEYVRDLEMLLVEETLFLTVKMLEKDVLVKFDFTSSLDDPLNEREAVLLGNGFKHFGIRTYGLGSGLYIDLLRESSVRINECYKNFQLVGCNFSDENRLDLRRVGGFNECTAYDLSIGSCTEGYSEFKPFALYCSANDVASGNCTEQVCSEADIDAGLCDVVSAPIHNLRIDRSLDRLGRWFPVTGFGEQTGSTMYLLSVDNIDSSIQEEGVLLGPSLFEVEVDGGTGNASLNTLNTQIASNVETVISGMLYQSLGETDPRIQMNLLTTDVVPVAGGSNFAPESRLVVSNFVPDELATVEVPQPVFSPLLFDRVSID